MASVVDICNLALAHLGDAATVATIDPPDGSAQATHCARFYPIARDALLEMHDWQFSTKRVPLAQVANATTEWDYCYAQPSDAINLLAVIPPDATDDYSMGAFSSGYNSSGNPIGQGVGGVYVPQPYAAESDAAGNGIILTDQPNAVLRYTSVVSDSTQFSPLFIETLSWLLAAKLAGPVLRGDAGRAAALECSKMAMQWMGQAAENDANQRRVVPQQNVAWMVNR